MLLSSLLRQASGKAMLADISSQNDQEDSVKKMLACNHCPKEFPTPSKLKRHVSQIHEGIKNYQCDRCDRAFGELCKLKKHVSIVHEGLKNYQCD